MASEMKDGENCRLMSPSSRSSFSKCSCVSMCHTHMLLSPQKEIADNLKQLPETSHPSLRCLVNSGIKKVSNGKKKSSETSIVREIISTVNSREGWRKRSKKKKKGTTSLH